MKSYKTEEIKMSFDEAVSIGKADAEEIKDELDNWRSGMEGTNLENSQKYSDLEEAVSSLESVESLEDPSSDLIELVDENSITVTVFIQVPKRKKANTSRAVRLSNAQAHLSAAESALDDLLSKLDSDKEAVSEEDWTEEMEEKYNNAKALAQEYMDELSNYASYMDIEVPGMY